MENGLHPTFTWLGASIPVLVYLLFDPSRKTKQFWLKIFLISLCTAAVSMPSHFFLYLMDQDIQRMMAVTMFLIIFMIFTPALLFYKSEHHLIIRLLIVITYIFISVFINYIIIEIAKYILSTRYRLLHFPLPLYMLKEILSPFLGALIFIYTSRNFKDSYIENTGDIFAIAQVSTSLSIIFATIMEIIFILNVTIALR